MTDRLKGCSFEQWLASWFDTEVAEDEIAAGGKFRLYWCDLDAATEIEYLTRLFRTGGGVLSGFSDAQLNEGFWEMIGASGILTPVITGTMDAAARRCLSSLPHLFRDVFAARCGQGLGHLDEPDRTPLNSICYMWWDVFPMLIGSDEDDARDQLLLRVLEEQLTIPHDAVRESALHGLGHAIGQRHEVETIIDRFLERTAGLRQSLRAYALSARAMSVQ